MKYTIKHCEEEDSEYIADRYDEDASLIMPPDPSGTDEKYIFKIEDDKGNIVGGCILEIDSWMVANITTLWVDEYCRGRGLGTALIKRAEHIAREKLCSIAVLGTYDFQARSFYEKRGYTVCGVVKNLPRGHETYPMAKHLENPLFGNEFQDAAGEETYVISLGSEEDEEEIGNRLCEYDQSIVSYEHEPGIHTYKVVDEEGNIVAGSLISIDGWNCMQIEFLWVEETLRGQGIGSELLRTIEYEAREHGRYIAIVGVNEWQATFFIRYGYKISAIIMDCPKGYSWLLLEKAFL
ncbi:MAG: GNAT family N-acetyltransferase [Lachnospiraceae bacterium]|nr:GNAT family N-acetyltransferase [Lachnospiraceae bacterium]